MVKKTNKTIKEGKLSAFEKRKISKKKRSSEYSERKQFLKRLKEND